MLCLCGLCSWHRVLCGNVYLVLLYVEFEPRMRLYMASMICHLVCIHVYVCVYNASHWRCICLLSRPTLKSTPHSVVIAFCRPFTSFAEYTDSP